MSAVVSKLSIVDLAGSEKTKDAGVSGKQLEEAGHINSSLLHLINVVKALRDKKLVPYRNSKLT